MSSVKAVGERSGQQPLDDRAIPVPGDDYGRSKLRAEQLLAELASEARMSIVSLRPPLIYGPGVGANFLALLRAADTPLPLPLGGVVNARTLIFVENLADAVGAVLDGPAISGVWLVSDDSTFSTSELIRECRRLLNRSPMLYPVPQGILRFVAERIGKGAAIERLIGSLAIDSSGFRTTFRWQPPASPREGLEKTIRWYRGERRRVAGF
jgi:nucleoside-diphosphate-sugar epimerase